MFGPSSPHLRPSYNWKSLQTLVGLLLWADALRHRLWVLSRASGLGGGPIIQARGSGSVNRKKRPSASGAALESLQDIKSKALLAHREERRNSIWGSVDTH